MRLKPIAAPNDWQHLTYHPLSNRIAFGVGMNVEALAEHMTANGYDENEPIVLVEGDDREIQILDGRGRHAAAIIAGILPKFAFFEGPNLWQYVRKKAVRAHLTPSQLAAFVVETVPKVSNRHDVTLAGQKSPASFSQTEAAKMVKVSRTTVKAANKVHEQGTADLWDAVRDNHVAASDAAAIVILPPEEQNAALEKVKEGKAKTLKEAAGLDRPERLQRVPKQERVKKWAVFNWKAWDKDWAWLKTAPDRIKTAYESESGGGSKDYVQIRKLLKVLEARFARWRQRLNTRR